MSEAPDAQDRLSQLVEQQAALRRVATLVARGVSPSEVFAAVADEMVNCMHVDDAMVLRYEADMTATVVSAHVEPRFEKDIVVGACWPLEGNDVVSTVFRTGRSTRDNLDNPVGPLASYVHELGFRCGVGVPILVDDRLWGVTVVGFSTPEPVPADTEKRIGDFTELIRTAIANAVTRDQLRELAEHQAALRRVATLVARGVSPSQVFAAVAEEMVNCLHVENAGVLHYEADGTGTVVSIHFEPQLGVASMLGSRWPLDGNDVSAVVLRTRRAARWDSGDSPTAPPGVDAHDLGLRSAVGVPVVVDGKLWGCAGVGSSKLKPLPADTEERMRDFTDLVSTAIANAATRDELRVLAEHQAALRRVATLVARGAGPSEVFAVVADEMRRCLHMMAALWRYEPSGEITLIAGATDDPAMLVEMPVGTRTSVAGNTLASAVLRTGGAARMDFYDDATGPLATRIRDLGVRAAVGVPVIVDGILWGLASVGSMEAAPLPPDAEARIGDFAELVATAIASAATRDELIATRDELIASRARIVAAGDHARRRLERDLHDGAQQRLVSLGLELRLAEQLALPEQSELKGYLSHAVAGSSDVLKDLQEISRGIHPAILSDGGLRPALKSLARRCPVPANVDVRVEQRLPDSIGVAAYYVVAEALTNAAKHADASAVDICAELRDADLYLLVQDDGVGGADAHKGSGLTGLIDRVEALGGHMNIVSPAGSGTSMHVAIPLSG